MAKMPALERSGIALFLSFLAFLGGVIGFVLDLSCGRYSCGVYFLVLGVFLFLYGIYEVIK